ncbi:hypothetical protein TcWFU_004997 [Taenia crassiceps]|uniref:Uncharacterized protein n=1 Tax=Taenia crassiceps TaxID=6207 RepID=A0ABR4QH59_9CEST
MGTFVTARMDTVGQRISKLCFLQTLADIQSAHQLYKKLEHELELNWRMTTDAEYQPRPRCCSLLHNAVGIRRRHFCMGTVILCLSIGILIAESQQPSYSYTGYWMGCANLVAALTAFVCAAKPHQIAFVIAALFDAICTILNVAGVCCKWKALDEVDYASSSAVTATNMEAGNSTRNGNTAATANPEEDRGQERRRRRTQSPPADFRLPDEVPRLPDYEELNKLEGLPPRYDSLRIPPPAFSASVTVE